MIDNTHLKKWLICGSLGSIPIGIVGAILNNVVLNVPNVGLSICTSFVYLSFVVFPIIDCIDIGIAGVVND